MRGGVRVVRWRESAWAATTTLRPRSDPAALPRSTATHGPAVQREVRKGAVLDRVHGDGHAPVRDAAAQEVADGNVNELAGVSEGCAVHAAAERGDGDVLVPRKRLH